MSDGRELVYLYTAPWGEDFYAVRDVANAWHNAGRPPINSAWRSGDSQNDAWMNSPAMGGTGSPADNPNDPENYDLGHVRGAALDIDPTPDTVAALTAAGLVRPFWWEGWHWAAPDVRYYPLVWRLPANVPALDPPPDNSGTLAAQLRRRRTEG